MHASRRRLQKNSCLQGGSIRRSPAESTGEISSHIRSVSPSNQARSHRRMPTKWAMNLPCVLPKDDMHSRSQRIPKRHISITTSSSIPSILTISISSRTSFSPALRCSVFQISSALNMVTASFKESPMQSETREMSIPGGTRSVAN